MTLRNYSELGFDYLRDNMSTDIENVVQRPFQFCVIDEVDSILIDEARTPLIISGQVDRPQEKYLKAAQLASSLFRAEDVSKDGIDPVGDYEVDEKQRVLTDEVFVNRIHSLSLIFMILGSVGSLHYKCIEAKELLSKILVIVRNDEAVIVDEFTGRIMSGRRWSDNQHQAIEAKEGLSIQPETQTLAQLHIKISFYCIRGLQV